MIIYHPGEKMYIDENKFKVIAEETNITSNLAKKYYAILNDVPCVSLDDKTHSLNCLYLLVYLLQNNKENNSFDYLISDSLYKTYGEIAYPYLDDEYKLTKKI